MQYDAVLPGGRVVDPTNSEAAIYHSTLTPARAIRGPELGTLSQGTEAGVAVLHWVGRPRSYAESEKG